MTKTMVTQPKDPQVCIFYQLLKSPKYSLAVHLLKLYFLLRKRVGLWNINSVYNTNTTTAATCKGIIGLNFLSIINDHDVVCAGIVVS